MTWVASTLPHARHRKRPACCQGASMGFILSCLYAGAQSDCMTREKSTVQVQIACQPVCLACRSKHLNRDIQQNNQLHLRAMPVSDSSSSRHLEVCAQRRPSNHTTSSRTYLSWHLCGSYELLPSKSFLAQPHLAAAQVLLSMQQAVQEQKRPTAPAVQHPVLVAASLHVLNCVVSGLGARKRVATCCECLTSAHSWAAGERQEASWERTIDRCPRQAWANGQVASCLLECW